MPSDLYGLTPVPMLWGYDQISDFQNLVVKGYANHVLGMNECVHKLPIFDLDGC